MSGWPMRARGPSELVISFKLKALMSSKKGDATLVLFHVKVTASNATYLARHPTPPKPRSLSFFIAPDEMSIASSTPQEGRVVRAKFIRFCEALLRNVRAAR